MLLNTPPLDGEREAWLYTRKPEFFGGDVSLRESYKLVFLNGELISGVPDFCKLLPVADFGCPSDFSSLFTVINNCRFAKEGFRLYINSGCAIDMPIDIFYLVTVGEVHSRGEIVLKGGSSVKICEHFVSLGPNACTDRKLVNHVNTISLESGACLQQEVVQLFPLDFDYFYTCNVVVDGGSSYRGLFLSSGGKLSRMEVHVHLQGGSKAEVRGLSVLEGTQHCDFYFPILHNCKGAYSRQHFRSVLKDKAKFIFYGRIEVPRGAEKSEAHQLNKNLLLSDGAKVNSRPELEILNDDIACSHGSTIGQLDADALYYLCARGIDSSSAKRILISAFVAELLEEAGADKYFSMLLGNVIEAIQ